MNNERTKRRLSSGDKNLYARDDASMSAIATKMRGQVNGVKDALYNAQQALTLVQTAEDGMNGVSDMVRRIHTLAVTSANDTLSDDTRATMQLEVDQILKEINRKADTVEFNNIKLLNGDNRKLIFHVGPNQDHVVSTNLIADMRTSALGLDGLSITTTANAESALDLTETAMNKISDTQTQISASGSRLESIINLNSSLGLSQSKGLSNISDADMAEEMVRDVREGILSNMSLNAISDSNTENGRVSSLLATTMTQSNLFL